MLHRATADLKRFIHDKSNIPPLIKDAPLHIQFETTPLMMETEERADSL